MKTIYITLAAVSAMAVAAPLAAQSWKGDASAPRSWNGDRSSVAQLQVQLDAGIQSGTITPREATPLRASLRQLIRMERQFSGNGFSVRERSSLQVRSANLHRQIDRAESNGMGRDRRADRDGNDGRNFADNDRRDGNDGRGVRDNDRRDFAGNDRRDMRGDRFAGDVRIGQRFSARQVALPAQYRDRYKDSAASYYRYDEDRIYQIDRVTGLITAMFSIGG